MFVNTIYIQSWSSYTYIVLGDDIIYNYIYILNVPYTTWMFSATYVWIREA